MLLTCGNPSLPLLRRVRPLVSEFYIGDGLLSYAVHVANNALRVCASASQSLNFADLLPSELNPSVLLSSRRSMIPHAIPHVLFSGAPAQISKSRNELSCRTMQGFLPDRTRTHKGFKHQTVNMPFALNIVFTQSYSRVTNEQGLPQYTALRASSGQGLNLTEITDLVQPLVASDGQPILHVCYNNVLWEVYS